MIASVIVDVPTMQTNQPYTYLVPEQLQNVIQAGMRVQVPFGNGNRLVQGFVTAVQADEQVVTDDGFIMKEIQAVTDPLPVFNKELLALGGWLAEQNFAFQISILQTMLPSVMRAKYSKLIQAADPAQISDEGLRTLFLDRAEVALDDENIPAELLPALNKALRNHEVQVEYVVGNRAKIKQVTAVKPALNKECYQELRAGLRANAKQQARLLDFLLTSSPDFVAQSELSKELDLTTSTITNAVKAGWLESEQKEVYRLPKLAQIVAPTKPLPLNAEQQAAFDQIAAAGQANEQKTFLLEGITGSGKTEVYLQAIAATLQQGKTAMMLVPEITLTPQMMRRVQSRFGKKVAVMHSGLSDGERYDEWRRVQRGEATVVVGTRSSIFAPLENIGLIIIDEEHESSYRQDDNPQYHARDVALWRAECHEAVVVLGSATPSLESRARAQRGLYQLLQLTKRAQASSLPTVSIVDMRDAIVNSNEDLLSPELFAKIEERKTRGEQSVLMLNRRGYANFLMCRDCGYVPQCQNCDLALTVHTDTHRLECHYCGYHEQLSLTCPNCGSERIRPFGNGTQKAEAELQKRLPDLRIMRMDVDTTRRKGAVDQMLADFGAKQADVLLGTQMIAKGLDFPDVTLVGVLNADTSLNLPDFRAAERTFQLLTQVAGRAGRADKAGEVVIQTFNPDHYAIKLAQQQDYEAFYQREMQMRRQWRYTPYFYTIQIKVAHTEQAEAAQVAFQTARWLKQKISSDSIILGPAPSSVARLKNKYYYRMVIKYRHDDGLEEALRELMEAAQRLERRKVQLSIDREPNTFI